MHKTRATTPDRAGRWGRAVAVAMGTGLAVSLAACASGGAAFTPKPVVTITPSPPARPTPVSPPATTPATSATPTATPTPSPSSEAVKGSGSIALYGTVSEKLTGTCGTVGGAPTLALADGDNDFYGTVDVTVVLAADKKSVTSVDGAFGEDSEGFTWKLAYRSANPAKGTSATVKTSASTAVVSGRLTAVETRKGKTTTEVLPFRVTVKCARSTW